MPQNSLAVFHRYLHFTDAKIEAQEVKKKKIMQRSMMVDVRPHPKHSASRARSFAPRVLLLLCEECGCQEEDHLSKDREVLKGWGVSGGDRGSSHTGMCVEQRQIKVTKAQWVTNWRRSRDHARLHTTGTH